MNIYLADRSAKEREKRQPRGQREKMQPIRLQLAVRTQELDHGNRFIFKQFPNNLYSLGTYVMINYSILLEEDE